jgi:hypothetical protein
VAVMVVIRRKLSVIVQRSLALLMLTDAKCGRRSLISRCLLLTIVWFTTCLSSDPMYLINDCIN